MSHSSNNFSMSDDEFLRKLGEAKEKVRAEERSQQELGPTIQAEETWSHCCIVALDAGGTACVQSIPKKGNCFTVGTYFQGTATPSNHQCTEPPIYDWVTLKRVR